MSLIDDYQNLNQAGVDDSSGNDPNAARRKRSELERQITILDSDLGKILREIEELEQQKRKFKKDEERIRVERDELDKTLDKLEDDRNRLEEGIRGLKKELKTLR